MRFVDPATDRVAIELSPIIAQDIETAARRNGLQGILDFFAVPGTWSPMYLREEAQLPRLRRRRRASG